MGRRLPLSILLLIALAGCAAQHETVSSPGDYVEIDNPAYTLSPDAPPTIMVPRSYVETGVPRGGALLEKGYESLRGNLAESGTPSAAARQATVAVPSVTPPAVPSPAVQLPAKAPAPVLKSRMLVVEVGKNALVPRFDAALKQASAGLVVDPAQVGIIARYASVGTPADRSSLAVKLQEDFGVNLVLYLAAPEGIAAGRTVSVEMYEAHGGSLVRKFAAVVPSSAAADSAVASTLARLAGDVRETAALVPWYGRVVSVDGSRVYLNAGKESGVRVGGTLQVYRPGKVVGTLGFAPGKKVGTLEISGFVGTDGAFGVLKDGHKAEVSDLVGLE